MQMNREEKRERCHLAETRTFEVPVNEVTDLYEWHKKRTQCRVYSRWVHECGDCSFNFVETVV